MKKVILILLFACIIISSQSIFAVEHDFGKIIEMSVGHEHSLLLREDGLLLGTGSSMGGGLGPNLIGYANTIPIPMFEFEDVTSVAAGNNYSLILKEDGTVWEFGSGQYRSGMYEDHIPTQVEGLEDIVKIVSGYHINYAIKSDGSVWYWLPKWDKTSINSGLLKSVEGISGAKDISSNGTHCVLLKNDGTVWQWSEYKRIVNGNSATIVTLDEFEPVQVFLEDEITPLSGISKITSRYFGWSVALKDDGTLWEWQYHPYKDELREVRQVPGIKNIGDLPEIIDINSGAEYTMALTKTGNVIIWGKTFPWIYGSSSIYPTYVTDQHNPPNNQLISKVTQIATKYDHALLLHEDGSITGFGNNTFGQLGNGNKGRYFIDNFRLVERFATKVLLEESYEIIDKYRNYLKWDIQEKINRDVLKNNWRVKLNKNIDLDTVTDDNIYLTDARDEKLPVTIKIEDDNTIYIKFKDLTQSEFAGNVYYLVVTDNIKNIHGEKLETPIRMVISGYLNPWSN